MKKIFAIAISVLCLLLVSWNHKFYVGIYQLNHNQDKKMLEVTCRIFVDDLNAALGKKYHKKFRFGEPDAAVSDVNLMTKYISDNFTIGINQKPKAPEYRSYEIENNVLIAYFRILNVSKVSSLQVRNSILFESMPEQQNIIQAKVGTKKQNLLLTISEPSGEMNF